MRNPFATKFTGVTGAPVVEGPQVSEKDREAAAVTNAGQESDSDGVDITAQKGVQKIEAITKVWSTQHLILAYLMIWVIYFIDAMESGLSALLTPYVTSAFLEHSLTSTTGVMSSLIGGISKLTLAKILDIWGRPQGFMVCVVLLTCGLIMMAACQNVETYAAAQVFYWVGFNGISYCMSIFIADTSHLKNRGLMLAFVASPYIVTTWVTGPLASSVLTTIGWRWGYGVFAIVTPVMCMPLFALFTYNYSKAKNMGLVPEMRSGRSLMGSIKYYFWEFDIICLVLLSGGFALFLLPFNTYTLYPEGWRAPAVIAMIIVGGLLLIAAVVWEKFFAPVKFMPWELLMDRTVLGACILAAVLFIEFYIWNGYFTSFLQVALNVSVTNSGYIYNIYSIGSCLSSIFVGLLIRFTGRFKWLTLYFGVPLTILGVGLMIAFREPGAYVGYIVMCQIFIAFAGGACVIGEQVAVMAAAKHQHVAVVLAVEGMFANVGGAIGQTVAAAIWQGIFPVRLAELLPAEEMSNFLMIYGDIQTQLSYPWGSPTREAINIAYGEAQKWMLVAATAITVICIPAVAVWRDIKVKDFKQVKGNVI
jgi:MFS family permease